MAFDEDNKFNNLNFIRERDPVPLEARSRFGKLNNRCYNINNTPTNPDNIKASDHREQKNRLLEEIQDYFCLKSLCKLRNLGIS